MKDLNETFFNLVLVVKGAEVHVIKTSTLFTSRRLLCRQGRLCCKEKRFPLSLAAPQ